MGQKAKNTGKKSNKSNKSNTSNKPNSSITACRTAFYVERMLGRPFKKFNLLTINDEGQYFSSSENYLEIASYIKNANADYLAEYCLWVMRNLIVLNNDKTFYACINIRDMPEIITVQDKLVGVIDTTHYFWLE
tara:strand:- start:161 stop:562 length:402 start_codon:yes stop_codon:yes gene_type:complete